MAQRVWDTPGWWLAILAPLYLTAGHLAFGANTAALSMLFSCGAFVLAAAGLASSSGREATLFTGAGAFIAVCFAVVIAVAVTQLTPLSPDGPHPIWSLTDQAGVGTPDPGATVRGIIALGALAAVFVIGMILGSVDRRARLTVTMIIACAAGYCAWAFIEHFADPDRVFGLERTVHAGRLSGSFMSANSAATLFGVFAVVATARLWRVFKEGRGAALTLFAAIESYLRRGVAPGFTLLFAIWCLALTGSRAGLVAGLLGVAVVSTWEAVTYFGVDRRVRLAPRRTLAASLAVIVGVIALANQMGDRLAFLDTDVADRQVTYAAHAALASERLITGSGLGAFHVANDAVQTEETWRRLEPLGAVHSVYLQWVLEMGLVGALAMGLGVAAALVVIARAGVNARHYRGLFRAIIGVSVVVLAHGALDYGLQVPSIAALWSLLLGLGVGAAQPTPSRRPAE